MTMKVLLKGPDLKKKTFQKTISEDTSKSLEMWQMLQPNLEILDLERFSLEKYFLYLGHLKIVWSKKDTRGRGLS